MVDTDDSGTIPFPEFSVSTITKLFESDIDHAALKIEPPTAVSSEDETNRQPHHSQNNV